ncbi:MAG: SDR family oxidoreductase [Streptosporangiaceae bacterium]|nr:SDR family oxidoreductase [Streptosporangiaceae bacterium]MBV9854020.1 SDR family oxidoreductase [Streptosporangiaceae bacterium]
MPDEILISTALLRSAGATAGVEGSRLPGGAEVARILRRLGLETAMDPGTAASGDEEAPDIYCVLQTGNEAFGSRDAAPPLQRETILRTVRAMSRRRTGRVILITDSGQHINVWADPARSAQRAADLHWFRHLTARAAGHGITGNEVTVGYAPFLGHRLKPEREQQFLGGLLIPRFAVPDDLTAALRMLASRGAAHLAGETVPLTGGMNTHLVPPNVARMSRPVTAGRAPAGSGDPFSIAGRVVLLAGATSRTGRAVARELARRGAALAVVARRPESLEQIVAELREIGATAWGIPADLTDPGSAELVVDRFWDITSGIDVMIYAAGKFDFDVIGDNRERRGRMLGINLCSFAEMCDALAERWILTRRPGTVVSVGMAHANMPAVPHVQTYGSSKAAMVDHTRLLAATGSRYGIRANSVCTGAVRCHGQPDWYDGMAGLVCYLASPASSYVTGAAITLDGDSGLAHSGAPLRYTHREQLLDW